MKKILILLLLTSLTWAGQNEKKLSEIIKQKNEVEKRLAQLEKEKDTVLNQIYRIELEKKRNQIELSRISINLQATEAKIEDREREKSTLEVRVDEVKNQLEETLRVLYKMGKNPTFKLLTRIDRLDQLFQNYRLFMELVNFKQDEISQIRLDIENINRLKEELNREFSRANTLKKEKLTRSKQIAASKREKQNVMAKISNNNDYFNRMFQELKFQEEQLNQLLFDKNFLRGGKDIDFKFIKGKLDWPIIGKVVSQFGKKRTRFSTYILNNGIEIQPSGSDTIYSIYPGVVWYAKYLQGYGNMIIIKHAKNLATIYAHCQSFLKREGDVVSEGEAIALAGTTGSTQNKSVYFEIRPNLKPQNPLLWLKKR